MAHTGTPDPVYDLISVAYHALQGAETYEQYAEDAQAQGDQGTRRLLPQDAGALSAIGR